MSIAWIALGLAVAAALGYRWYRGVMDAAKKPPLAVYRPTEPSPTFRAATRPSENPKDPPSRPLGARPAAAVRHHDDDDDETYPRLAEALGDVAGTVVDHLTTGTSSNGYHAPMAQEPTAEERQPDPPPAAPDPPRDSDYTGGFTNNNFDSTPPASSYDAPASSGYDSGPSDTSYDGGGGSFDSGSSDCGSCDSGGGGE